MLAACSEHTDADTRRRRKPPTPAPDSVADTAPARHADGVGVLGLGIGTFDLAAFPVASLKNEAKYHGAAMA